MKSYPLTIHFKSDPNPGTPHHVKILIETYLQSKGVAMEENGNWCWVTVDNSESQDLT